MKKQAACYVKSRVQNARPGRTATSFPSNIRAKCVHPAFSVMFAAVMVTVIAALQETLAIPCSGSGNAVQSLPENFPVIFPRLHIVFLQSFGLFSSIVTPKSPKQFVIEEGFVLGCLWPSFQDLLAPCKSRRMHNTFALGGVHPVSTPSHIPCTNLFGGSSFSSLYIYIYIYTLSCFCTCFSMRLQ